MSSSVISCQQIIKVDILKVICSPIFSSLSWFLFSSAVSRYLLLAVYIKKHWTGIFMYILNMICVPSCWQQFTADDSWYERELTGIFMYTLKLILMPNFSSLALFYFHQLSTAVISCWQLMTAVTKKIKWNFLLLPKCDICAKF